MISLVHGVSVHLDLIEMFDLICVSVGSQVVPVSLAVVVVTQEGVFKVHVVDIR